MAEHDPRPSGAVVPIRGRAHGRPRRPRARLVTKSGHAAPDALKMGCPFCACSRSAVVRSRGLITHDKIHRRRECAQCGRRFPTRETVDRAQLQRELQARGAAPPPVAVPPATWGNAALLVERLREEALEGDYVDSHWQALAHVLDGLQRGA